MLANSALQASALTLSQMLSNPRKFTNTERRFTEQMDDHVTSCYTFADKNEAEDGSIRYDTDLNCWYIKPVKNTD